MQRDWRQGQHVAVMGRTGRGKTSLARDLLALRGWAVVLAIKRKDDTLETFPKAGYRIIRKWPPRWEDHRVVLWAKPKSMEDMAEQRKQIAAVLNDVYANGGWAVLFDDVARIANALGFKKWIATMLSEARSSHASIVSNMTQPSSVTQAIPSEVWRQVRYHLVFYYRVGRDLDAIADIVGYTRTELKKWMAQLGPWDFLAFDDLTDTVTVVRT
ncbi:MAG TPA: hypothetical protein VJQ45_00135 [Ktedonobacterales bacterium]|nr:hypothetical protein [Ktedonobacterales bacterium]